jgi:hypothetical protein
MDSLFIDFVGPLTRSKGGNIAILVAVDNFSKSVSFFPVRKISSQAVIALRNRIFLPLVRRHP